MYRCTALIAIRQDKGELDRPQNREATRLVARIDPGDIRHAIAGHIVVILGRAQLLCWVELELDGAARSLGNRFRPVGKTVLCQRMLIGQPVGETQGYLVSSQDMAGEQHADSCRRKYFLVIFEHTFAFL
ncbi:hypothetical protein D3C86_1705280 [compost metagenome]